MIINNKYANDYKGCSISNITYKIRLKKISTHGRDREMNFKLYKHKSILIHELHNEIIDEFLKIVSSISENTIQERFENSSKRTKSLTYALKDELNESLLENGFENEINIFSSPKEAQSKRFTYDYFKDGISIEFGFHHEMASAWKLIKGSLEFDNRMIPNQNSQVSIIISVTKDMKIKGGFDGSIATYEKYISYLGPMYNNVIRPIILVGLLPFDSFSIKHNQYYDKTVGKLNFN